MGAGFPAQRVQKWPPPAAAAISLPPGEARQQVRPSARQLTDPWAKKPTSYLSGMEGHCILHPKSYTEVPCLAATPNLCLSLAQAPGFYPIPSMV